MRGNIPVSCRGGWFSDLLHLAGAAALVASVCACGSGGSQGQQPMFAVLSAFPAELAAVLEQATVEDTVMVNGHVFRIGTLGGVPALMGMTGIGLVNATATTDAVLDQFNVTGVIVSAVAGSSLVIGDVVVPQSWELDDGSTYPVDRRWFEFAAALSGPGAVSLDRCTVPVSDPSQGQVCILQEPTVVLGGVGHSSDPFGGTAFPCQPNDGDVFGCDVGSGPAASGPGADRVRADGAAADTAMPIVDDMETAAIAREAAAHGVRFIAFRAVSDGAGDPLGLPGFPSQFFAYYRLAAHNAAAATVAFIKGFGGGPV